MKNNNQHDLSLSLIVRVFCGFVCEGWGERVVVVGGSLEGFLNQLVPFF